MHTYAHIRTHMYKNMSKGIGWCDCTGSAGKRLMWCMLMQCVDAVCVDAVCVDAVCVDAVCVDAVCDDAVCVDTVFDEAVYHVLMLSLYHLVRQHLVHRMISNDTCYYSRLLCIAPYCIVYHYTQKSERIKTYSHTRK